LQKWPYHDKAQDLPSQPLIVLSKNQNLLRNIFHIYHFPHCKCSKSSTDSMDIDLARFSGVWNFLNHTLLEILLIPFSVDS